MTPSEHARVLIVDDEPELRELLADVIGQERGVEVRLAASGDEAICAARSDGVDLLVTDVYLGDANGLDVIDRLRSEAGDIPAVVITGRGDANVLSEASRRRPVEVLNKPLDLPRLRAAVHAELARRTAETRRHRRQRRLRRIARRLNAERKDYKAKLDTTCADLTSAYRSLSARLVTQKTVIDYQQALLAARCDDDVFRVFFATMVRRSGPLFGVAMVCNEEAELKVAGRFGAPEPDGSHFCSLLARPMVGQVLAEPRCQTLDATDQTDLFDPSIRRFLCGVNILAVPLMPGPGEMIGLVVLYRKGEQPFTDEDVTLAEALSAATGVALQRIN